MTTLDTFKRAGGTAALFADLDKHGPLGEHAYNLTSEIVRIESNLLAEADWLDEAVARIRKGIAKQQMLNGLGEVQGLGAAVDVLIVKRETLSRYLAEVVKALDASAVTP
jgi:hypothetical protein